MGESETLIEQYGCNLKDSLSSVDESETLIEQYGCNLKDSLSSVGESETLIEQYGCNLKDSLSSVGESKRFSVGALSVLPVGVGVTWHRPVESERLIEHDTDQWKVKDSLSVVQTS